MTTGIIDQVYATANGEEIPIYNSDGAVGAGFTGNGGKITQAKFLITDIYPNHSGLLGDMHAAIYAHSGTWGTTGTPTGNPLATSESTSVQTLINDIGNWVSFDFTGNNQFQTIIGQRYFICLVADNIWDYGMEQWMIGLGCTTVSSAFNGGTTVEKNYGGWFVSNGDKLLFQLYGNLPPSYTVTYNGNNHTSGTAPTDNNSPYLNGSIVTVLGPNTLTKTNSVFLGWATTHNATLAQYTLGSKFILTGNTTLYAVWGPTNTPFYAVTYNGNNNTNGTVPVDASVYSQGVSVNVATNPGDLIRYGYTFMGWATTSSAPTPTYAVNGSTTNPYSFNMPAYNVILYAVWKFRNGLIAQINGPPSSAYVSYLTGNALGYGFKGDGCKITTAKFVMAKGVASLTGEVYAAIYTHNCLGGSSGLSGKPLAVSDTVDLSELPENADWVTFTFSGENQLQTLLGVSYFICLVSQAVSSYGGLGIEVFATEVPEVFNVDSVAFGEGNIWAVMPFNSFAPVIFQLLGVLPVVCSVTYNGNGASSGAVPVDSNNLYIKGLTVTVLDKGTLTKTNAKFLGWATTMNASLAQYAKDSQFIITSNVVLYAVWGPTSTPFYTITYNGNGATGGNLPVNNNSYSQGVLVNVAANPGGLIRSEYVFSGWDIDPLATVPTYVVKGLKVTPSSLNIPGSNVVLYAVWKPIPKYTVTYDKTYATGGVVPVDVNSPYLEGSTVTVLGNTGGLGLTGFGFGGWCVNSDYIDAVASGNYWEMHSPGDTFTIMGDTVLYAMWFYGGPPVGNQYVVNYNGNGCNNPPKDVPVDYNVYQYNATVTVLGPGTLFKSAHEFLGWSIDSKATKAQYIAGSKFKITNSVMLYAVWGPCTVVVPFDGRKAGVGSKQEVIQYNGAPLMMSVASNYPGNVDKNAVIENLIIDGTGAAGSTGILLENVCNCLIRNLTIKNCEVGIKVQITGNGRAFGNRFEHIRMINVKTGILFTGTSGNKDFAYTTIDDVGMSLSGSNQNSSGIKVDTNAELYNAFIKATVWINQTGHKGMEVSGKVKYSLVNLEAENIGTGLYVSSTGVVSDNQSFLLAALLPYAGSSSKVSYGICSGVDDFSQTA